MKRLLSTIIPVCLLLLSGCMRDEGSYDYRDVNKMEIVGLNDVEGKPLTERITVSAQSTLLITPVMNETAPDMGGTFSYRWYIYNAGIQAGELTEEITISEERDLDWFVTALPGNYVAVFTATNTDTEVSTSAQFYMTVLKQNVGTLMVASNIDGAADLTARTPAGEWELDVYGTANGHQAGGEAVWVASARLFQTPEIDNSILLTSEGGAYFGNASFRETQTFDQMFYDAPAVVNPQAYYLGYGYFGSEDQLELLINDGKLHYRITAPSEDMASSKFTEAFDGDYRLSRYAIAHNGSNLFYDELNRRFRLVTANLAIWPGPNWGDPDSYEYTVRFRSAYIYDDYSYDPSVIAAFDPDNVGLDMLWFGSIYTNRQDLGYALMRDPANPNSLWRLKFFAGGLNDPGGWVSNFWQSMWKMPISVQTGLADATNFTVMRNNPYIYYSVGSEVWLYNPENDINRRVMDVSSVVAGAEVDCLYIRNDGMNRNNEALNYLLYVAVSPPAGTGRCGSIIEVKLQGNGEYESHTVDSEVVGRVVSMAHQM